MKHSSGELHVCSSSMNDPFFFFLQAKLLQAKKEVEKFAINDKQVGFF